MTTTGKPHAEQTQTAFEQGLAEKVRLVKGAVATLGHAFRDDSEGLYDICDILRDVGMGNWDIEDASVGIDVEKIVRGD